MNLRLSFIFIVFWHLCLLIKACQSDIWNRVVRLQSNLTALDYTFTFSQLSENDAENTFSLELFSDHSYTFCIFDEKNSLKYQGKGTYEQIEWLALTGQSYELKGQSLKGTVQYSIKAGIEWKYYIQVPQKHLKINRQNIEYFWINTLALLLFGVVGFIIFPLCQKERYKLIYNIQKRTHMVLMSVVLFKFYYVWACLLVNCYTYATNMAWYYLFPIYGLYLICLAPSILHAIHFLTAIQLQFKQHDFFVLLSPPLRNLLLALVFFGTPFFLLLTILVTKSVIFYFVLSAAIVYQFFYSVRSKRYAFFRVLFYDLLLTATLTVLGLFLPNLNFEPLTWKQVLVFWNYYLGLCIFGVLFSIRLIKMEILQERQLREESDFVRAQLGGQSDRGREEPKIQSIELMTT